MLLKELLAEASEGGACRVESSPLRLFRHTGHVSCWRGGGEKAAEQEVGSRVGRKERNTRQGAGREA